jgi:hypothetical protein
MVADDQTVIWAVKIKAQNGFGILGTALGHANAPVVEVREVQL